MKRFLSFILTVALVFSIVPTGLFSVTVRAETVASGTCGGDWTWCLDGNGLLTISGTGEMTDYQPSSRPPWHSQRTSIKSVRIEDGVTTIGDRAFFECTNLASVSVPDGVTSIGELAFKFCKKLTSITLPDSVKTIDAAAFYECTSLTGITIPGSVTSIGQEAFYGCTNLSRVTIGDGVYEIGCYAFGDCTSLTNITIPNSVTYINTDVGGVFSGCTSLASVTIGDGVKYISKRTFDGCTSLTNVTIGNSVKEIHSYAFGNCTSLTSITIPDGVRLISDCAFFDCRSLVSITIPNSLDYIRSYAFDGCDRLRDIWYQGSYDEKDDMLISRGNDYLNSAIWHYNACARHTYDNYCDEQCNICGELRVAEHIYDDVCDISCNLCETTREAPHNYEWIIDQEGSCGGNGIKHEECTVCHIKRNENTIMAALKNHTFTDRNDTECNVCKQGFVLIQFNSNGGTSLSSIRTLPNQTTTLHTAIPTRAGYNFAGWARSKAGDVLYQPGDDFQTEQSVTLYAQWDKRCETCSGTGKTTCNSCSGVGTKEVAVKCTECNGGKISCGGCLRWIGSLDELDFKTDANGYFGYICPYCRNFGLMGMPEIGLFGQAFYECSTCYATGKEHVNQTCNSCSGNGKRNCSTCRGSGEAVRTSVSAPAAPTLKNVTANTVTLKAITNGEYSIGGDVWQESPIFDNLEEGQAYRFHQRYAKTDTEYASYSSIALTVLAHDHTFDNACDALCNLCEYTRTVPDHVYDNECETECSICGYTRTITHKYEWITDEENTCGADGIKHEECSVCHATQNTGTVIPATGNHRYDNACDTECNVCGYARTITHKYEWIIDEENTCGADGIKHEECSVCHAIQNTGTVIPATGNHRYDNACDTECNGCSLERSVPDHIYDNACDAVCNECKAERTVPDHIYDNACDANCNECGSNRSVPDHVYDNVCDADCNVCHLTREVGPHFVVYEGDPYDLNNSQTYPFALADGWYNSTNKSNSSSATFTLTANYNCSVVVTYKVSSEQNYDKLVIKKNSDTLVTASGSISETEITITLVEGDILTFTYSKDGSYGRGTDTASFRFVSDSHPIPINADELEADCLNAVVCSGCGTTVKPISTEHTYDNACDTTCNICGVVRTVPHIYDDERDHICNECGYVAYIPGDFTKDNAINNEDVIYLLWHTMFPESYPVEANADFDGDGEVNNEDVIYLLWHTMFPESYPLYRRKEYKGI